LFSSLKEDEEFIDRDFRSYSDEKDDQGNKNSLSWQALLLKILQVLTT
jgi:hypothetical protein